MNRNYYMVRAMHSRPEDFEIFFKNKVVAVGWSEIDFTHFVDSQNLKKETRKIYYASGEHHPPTVGKNLNEVVRFHNIKAGDYIIIPYYNGIRLAIAKEKHLYDETCYDADLANQIEVDYLMTSKDFKTIPRNSLSEGLQRRLRVRGSTVSNLFEFKDQIEKLFSRENYSWTSDYEEKENRLIEEVKRKLFHNIQHGKTNLITGGIGMEKLVRELLICEGYTASILAKNAFDDYGDADILAVKADKFQETKILVQVKHHSGYSDTWGIDQLRKIQSGNEYADHKFVLITSALVGDDVREKATISDINIVDGKELIDWIFENLSKLKIETKALLGLSGVPQIV